MTSIDDPWLIMADLRFFNFMMMEKQYTGLILSLRISEAIEDISLQSLHKSDCLSLEICQFCSEASKTERHAPSIRKSILSLYYPLNACIVQLA
jgi:hypothetical protein